jgi:uncharacterized RDD family membrane protein YckC
MQNPPPPPPPASGPPPQYMPPPGPYAPQMAGYPVPAFAAGKTYGGFWMRLVARIVDGIIITVPLGVIFGVFVALAGGIASTANTTDQNAQAAVGIGLIGVWLLIATLATIGTVAYFVYFWGTSGSTLGMRIFSLRVVDADTGARIGIPRAIVRYLMSIVNSLACYIGWIWIAFDPRKQGWHDKVANSVVIQG